MNWLQWRAGQLPGQTARSVFLDRVICRGLCFNGGPGNCPAKHLDIRAYGSLDLFDQRFNGGPGNCPAKLGRDGSGRTPHRWDRSRFNGGPGNCPAKRATGWGVRVMAADPCFNGGPGNCPAKHSNRR